MWEKRGGGGEGAPPGETPVVCSCILPCLVAGQSSLPFGARKNQTWATGGASPPDKCSNQMQAEQAMPTLQGPLSPMPCAQQTQGGFMKRTHREGAQGAQGKAG